jgi:hypothetical protein
MLAKQIYEGHCGRDWSEGIAKQIWANQHAIGYVICDGSRVMLYRSKPVIAWARPGEPWIAIRTWTFSDYYKQTTKEQKP